MAEPAAHHEDHDEEDTPGYVPPAEKKLDDIVNQDQDDPSLKKYKEALLGADLGKGAAACKSSYMMKLRYESEGVTKFSIIVTIGHDCMFAFFSHP